VQLARRDLEAIVRFLREAATDDGPQAFPRRVLAELRPLVPCDCVTYSELDRVREEGLGDEAAPEPNDDDFPDAAVYWRLRHEHPVCHHQDVTGEFQALKLSDFVTRRELRRREIYAEWFRPSGVEHEMCVGLDAPLWHTKVFLFDRSGPPDFGERDRAVLDALRPHLARLYRAAQQRRRLAETLDVLEGTEAAVVLLDRAGGIEFATPSTRRLLAAYLGCDRSRLPEPVESWRRHAAPGETLTIKEADAQLVVHSVGGALLLEEQRADGLTAREREILDLVADGSTNAEIAAALWVSPHTVRRHLENTFRKLGVHTRTAAAAQYRRRRREGAKYSIRGSAPTN
jgi:DNA-binding CsgD family transcriptional regulator